MADHHNGHKKRKREGGQQHQQHQQLAKRYKQPLPKQQQPKNLLRKTVRFAQDHHQQQEQQQAFPPLVQDLTLDLAKDIWYSPIEVVGFKRYTRHLLLLGNVPSSGEEENENEKEDCWTGLERFSSQRSRWKKSSIRCVLLAQKQLRQRTITNNNNNINPQDFLRTVSLKCTSWATDLALMQGFQDFVQVYDPLSCLFESTSTCSTCTADEETDAPRTPTTLEDLAMPSSSSFRDRKQTKKKTKKPKNYNDYFFGPKRRHTCTSQETISSSQQQQQGVSFHKRQCVIPNANEFFLGL